MAQRLYRIKQLTSTNGQSGLLPVGPATVWRWCRDPHHPFPKPFKLSPRVTVWDASEIDQYLKMIHFSGASE